jgi:hypothetical protein
MLLRLGGFMPFFYKRKHFDKPVERNYIALRDLLTSSRRTKKALGLTADRRIRDAERSGRRKRKTGIWQSPQKGTSLQRRVMTKNRVRMLLFACFYMVNNEQPNANGMASVSKFTRSNAYKLFDEVLNPLKQKISGRDDFKKLGPLTKTLYMARILFEQEAIIPTNKAVEVVKVDSGAKPAALPRGTFVKSVGRTNRERNRSGMASTAPS